MMNKKRRREVVTTVRSVTTNIWMNWPILNNNLNSSYERWNQISLIHCSSLSSLFPWSTKITSTITGRIV